MHPYKTNIGFSKKFKYGYYQFFDHFFGRERFFKWTKNSRRRYYDSLRKKLEASGEGTCYEVDRVKDISYEDFRRNYYLKGKPVVLDGKAKDWPCVKEWSLDYFKGLHGDDKVMLLDQTDIVNKGHRELTLAEIIDEIRGDKGTYYRFYPLLKNHPEHLNDLDYEFLRNWRVKKTWGEAFHVFIGGKGSYTPIHNAATPNMFVQVHGEKEWRLIPNYYAPVIDPSPARNMYRSAPIRNGKDFNPFENNYDDFPLYRYIDTYKVHLKPGDVFFNSPYMWHAVKNPTDSIGIGYRTFTPWYSMRQAPLYAFLEMFAFNPPFWVSYKNYADVNLIQMIETGKIKEIGKRKSSVITQ